MKLAIIILSLSVFLGACSHHQHHENPKVQNITLDKMTTKNFKHLYLGAQPSTKDLKKAKEIGIKHIINLRSPKEKGFFNQAKLSKKLGMKYINIPFKPCQPSKKVFNEIESYLKSHRGEKTLIHCSTGNRAAAWLSSHMHTEHDWDVDQSLALGKEMGLTKDKMKNIIEFYMGGKTGEITRLKGCTDKK